MNDTRPILHLASSSPRRREILAALRIPFSHGGVDIDESRRGAESAEAMVMRLARDKALAVSRDRLQGLPVLAADTLVVLEERIFGKPASQDDALAMLAALSGKRHRVLTAIALHSDDQLRMALSDTAVQFRDIDPDEALAYWHSGEPAGKAGAYAIQGLGGAFVGALHGSYTGVVGLPVFETADLLREAGIDIVARANRT